MKSYKLTVLAAILGLGIAFSTPAHAGSDPLPPLPKPAGRPAPPVVDRPGAGGAKVATRHEAEQSERAKPETGAASGEGEGGPGAIGADGSYRLGPQDKLRIEIWNRAEVEYEWRPVTVTGEGTIFLPLLEDVQISGLTVPEVTEKLTRLYDQCCIIHPQVYVEITEYNSRKVSVIGEVKNPGRYSLKGSALLTEVLAEAGDLTENASSIVRLIRYSDPEQPPEVRDINLARINEGDPTENLRIEPNDQLYVLTNKDIVYVSGMVKTEGYVEWEEGLTAYQAVILAGGLADGSAANRSKVIRSEGSSVTEMRVNLKNRKQRFLLKPGDIIFVPKSWL